MKRKEPTDTYLIEQFACKRVKAALPEYRTRENIQSGLTWKQVWKKIRGRFR